MKRANSTQIRFCADVSGPTREQKGDELRDQPSRSQEMTRSTRRALPSSEVLDECEIRSLVIRERYCRDSNQWRKLRECYHPDASKTWLNISWFTGDVEAFIDGSINMAKGGTLSRHQIQPAEIQIQDDRAFAISTGSIQIRVELDGVEYELVSAMQLLTRLEKASGTWYIVRVEIIYDRDYIFPTRPLSNLKSIEPAKDARPSYKFLDYVLSRQGFSINKYLAGTDQAGREAAAKLITESEQWLAGKESKQHQSKL